MMYNVIFFYKADKSKGFLDEERISVCGIYQSTDVDQTSIDHPEFYKNIMDRISDRLKSDYSQDLTITALNVLRITNLEQMKVLISYKDWLNLEVKKGNRDEPYPQVGDKVLIGLNIPKTVKSLGDKNGDNKRTHFRTDENGPVFETARTAVRVELSESVFYGMVETTD